LRLSVDEINFTKENFYISNYLMSYPMNESLNISRQKFYLKKMSNYLLTALLLALVILVLSYFFHTGAGLLAELVIIGEMPEAVNTQ
jgi:ABC-type uncharacterized transport system permease subunit